MDSENPAMARAIAISSAITVLALLGACSGDAGPSKDKVIADSADLFRVSDITIDERRPLAEDRIEYELELARGVHFRAGQFPMDWAQVRHRGKQRVTVLYRMHDGRVWNMTEVWPTDKGRNPPLEVSR